MISITTGAPIPEQNDLVVYSQSGNYADTDLILCAETGNPLQPTAMLQAQYVRYGAIVYHFNTPETLGEALLALDLDSTHDAVALYKEQAARDAARNAGTLTPNADLTPEDTSLNTETDNTLATSTDAATSTEPIFESASSTPSIEPISASSTPEITLPTIDENTPPSVIGATSSTTPTIMSTTTATSTIQ